MLSTTSDPEGSCNCGAVRIVIKGGFSDTPGYLCHCLNCKKSCGGLASYNIDAMASSLSVIAGTPKVYKDRGNTGGGVVRYFCGDCGSSLWAEVNSVPGITYISAALFPMDRGVGMELFCKNMSSWEKVYAPEGNAFQTQPGE